MIKELDPYSIDGKTLNFRYHPGQRRAMASEKRFILMLAGSQGGKTVLSPWWLFWEMVQKGPGDYLVATPTFPLLELKALPEFKRLFIERLKLGTYKGSPSRQFILSEYGAGVLWHENQDYLFESASQPTRVLFGHAQDPESLESATIKAAVLDEAGQKKFKLGSWEAIQRRLSIHQGRVFLPTTPYYLGWLKRELHDRARAGADDIELIQFDSAQNPAFPREEYDRMQEILPRWKFNMMYRGIFERPAGMIYDCFSDENQVERFTIPSAWPRFMGTDFGGVNTAAVFIAQHPETKELFLNRTYHQGGLTAREHARKLQDGEPGQLVAFGGAKSEGQWRKEFRAAGLVIHEPPVSEVEIGIDRVYELLKTRKLKIFNDLTDIIDDIESYSRVLGDDGEPTEKIEDKETYHRLDALRYICSFLNNKTVRRRRVIRR